MKKGDMLWIKKQDNSIFCSEFDGIIYSTNYDGFTQYYIKLIPVIGNCVTISISKMELKEIYDNLFVVHATFDLGSYQIGQWVIVTSNINKLF